MSDNKKITDKLKIYIYIYILFSELSTFKSHEIPAAESENIYNMVATATNATKLGIIIPIIPPMDKEFLTVL